MYEAGCQLKLPIETEILIPAEDPVRLVSAVVERLDLKKIERSYSLEGRNEYPPRILLKLFVYGFMRATYSSREIERACRENMIDDFARPEFFPNKLRLMEKPKPHTFLLTGMSDLSGWQPEWCEQVFAKIEENPQHQFLFLSKRSDLLDIDCDLDNAWFGVTVTRRSELWRIDALWENVRAKHYHATFEPLFDDPGVVDLHNIDWIVVGTMTGAQSKKVLRARDRSRSSPI